ncbi:hypothetical protein RBG61_03425 [Paludicola sp. MB14-C6]|uniref:hypothetical protein n=1 Tax=Paludihabitans sp. MB14-C6 TaxID=3070656 RepID=UPI0027DDE65C|nr:hypothetical protein [Paludicola sp. MB14-C6]WMJ23725.1 hypothetical protein RBG61_03425 [Paludicola sp. MB14-C6]
MSEHILKSIQPTSDDLTRINQYTRRTLKEDEVYTFSVILCDNDIDRDHERFTNEALLQLEKLFVGKTGIFDHEPKGANQTARIFEVEFVTDTNKINKLGEPYCYLKAKAYMIKSQRNESLMLEIDGGIKKEVSVSCSVADITCSICGANQKSGYCEHIKGKIYSNKECHHLLSNVTDAYEWSFVAIPAQINAGVIKSYQQKEERTLQNTDTILKALNHCEQDSVVLTKQEADGISQYINELKQQAQLGEQYRCDLIKEVKRLSFLTKEHLAPQIIESVANKMDIVELKAFIDNYKQTTQNEPNIQLAKTQAGKNQNYDNFKL